MALCTISVRLKATWERINQTPSNCTVQGQMKCTLMYFLRVVLQNLDQFPASFSSKMILRFLFSGAIFALRGCALWRWTFFFLPMDCNQSSLKLHEMLQLCCSVLTLLSSHKPTTTKTGCTNPQNKQIPPPFIALLPDDKPSVVKK